MPREEAKWQEKHEELCAFGMGIETLEGTLKYVHFYAAS